MHQKLVIQLSIGVIAMFGFGYALVPLYDLICDVTGLNGKGENLSVQAAPAELVVDSDREVTIEFLTTLNQGAEFEFRPEMSSITLNPGEPATVMFHAVNLKDEDVIAQATASVAPWAVTQYLRKNECFCFEQQPFSAGQARELPLQLVIDPALPAHVDRLTLSYTMFDATQLASAAQIKK